MISILIPVYNYDCSLLIIELAAQSLQLKEELDGEFDYEIIVSDDASTDLNKQKINMTAALTTGSTYIQQKKNIGQAHLRNAMADIARFDLLLMIDADAEIFTKDFIRCYWQDRNKGDVICGTLKNPPGPAPSGCELRYRYEKKAEKARPATARTKAPYNYFSTFNVMFHREVFERIRFDERCTEYGYEDTLMGLMLKKHSYSVIHTDNPLIHKGIDSNQSFLKKTETAMRMLYKLGDPLQGHTGASRIASKLEKWHLKKCTKQLYKSIKKTLQKNLLSHHPSILLFNFYKLGYYCSLDDSNTI